MTAVFVHGNPETTEVWDLLLGPLAALGHDDPVLLAPPGFGAPIPDGWGSTVEEYRDWLIGELEAIGHPVDLVGHDWGGGHVMNVAMARPDLLRSWCSDAIGLFDVDYVWHPLAHVWQAPGDGEAWNADFIAQGPTARADLLAEYGMEASTAAKIGPAFDEAMGTAILNLYRSAAQPRMKELGEKLEAAAARPGLVILPTADQDVGTDSQRRRAAERAGARVHVMEDVQHWWMAQDPEGAASVLSEFWASCAEDSPAASTGGSTSAV